MCHPFHVSVYPSLPRGHSCIDAQLEQAIRLLGFTSTPKEQCNPSTEVCIRDKIADLTPARGHQIRLELTNAGDGMSFHSK
jgi:hypothetical protein